MKKSKDPSTIIVIVLLIGIALLIFSSTGGLKGMKEKEYVEWKTNGMQDNFIWSDGDFKVMQAEEHLENVIKKNQELDDEFFGLDQQLEQINREFGNKRNN